MTSEAQFFLETAGVFCTGSASKELNFSRSADRSFHPGSSALPLPGCKVYDLHSEICADFCKSPSQPCPNLKKLEVPWDSSNSNFCHLSSRRAGVQRSVKAHLEKRWWQMPWEGNQKRSVSNLSEWRYDKWNFACHPQKLVFQNRTP